MVKKLFCGLTGTLFLAAALQGQSRETLLKAVQETPRWSPVDKPTLYDEKNIEGLVGKRAPAILRYGLRGVIVQNWTGPNGNVRLTLIEMLDPSAAYGLFTLDRNIDQPGFTAIPT